LARSLANFGGGGTEEAWTVNNGPCGYRIVPGQVVALEAGPPRASVGWGAEHREIVFLRGSALPACGLNHLAHVLQTPERDRLDVARLAQSGCQQGTREVLLIGRHLSQRQSLAFFRNEMPVHALVCVEGK